MLIPTIWTLPIFNPLLRKIIWISTQNLNWMMHFWNIFFFEDNFLSWIRNSYLDRILAIQYWIRISNINSLNNFQFLILFYVSIFMKSLLLEKLFFNYNWKIYSIKLEKTENKYFKTYRLSIDEYLEENIWCESIKAWSNPWIAPIDKLNSYEISSLKLFIWKDWIIEISISWRQNKRWSNWNWVNSALYMCSEFVSRILFDINKKIWFTNSEKKFRIIAYEQSNKGFSRRILWIILWFTWWTDDNWEYVYSKTIKLD